MSSCKDIGKQLSAQYYSRPNINSLELSSPDTVIKESIDSKSAVIEYPIIKSPAMQNENEIPIFNIIQDLITAEKVARRQYDELIMNSAVKNFTSDLLYIRNDEHEHEKILECILSRVLGSAQPAAARTSRQIWKCPICEEEFRDLTTKEAQDLHIKLCHPTRQPTQKSLTLTPKTIGELYETMLDRFGDEEEKSVKNYEEFLVKVQESKKTLEEAWRNQKVATDTFNETMTPLNELERKVNKHLNEERVHLDVIDAMREMFTNMKLGNVY